jgi:hypothetical protein
MHGAVSILVACAVDEEGNQLFTQEQANVLVKKSIGAVMRIQRAAMKLNGWTAEAKEEAKND